MTPRTNPTGHPTGHGDLVLEDTRVAVDGLRSGAVPVAHTAGAR